VLKGVKLKMGIHEVLRGDATGTMEVKKVKYVKYIQRGAL
jgi:hypothetical protein